MKDGMIIYSSYVEKFKKLSDEQFGKLLRLILQYQMDGEIPEIDDLAVSVSFDIMKADLDRNNEKYQRVVERNRENGKKGGRPKNPTEPKKPNGLLGNPTEPKKADKDKDKDIGIRNKDIHIEENVESKAKRFTPPTVTEVSDYCRENNYNIDAQRFVDFYESKGWMVGKNKMKDWKAAVRNWARRQKEDNPSEKPLDERTQKRYAKYDEWERRGLEVDENTLQRREKYAELEKYYLGEEQS